MAIGTMEVVYEATVCTSPFIRYCWCLFEDVSSKSKVACNFCCITEAKPIVFVNCDSHLLKEFRGV